MRTETLYAELTRLRTLNGELEADKRELLRGIQDIYDCGSISTAERIAERLLASQAATQGQAPINTLPGQAKQGEEREG